MSRKQAIKVLQKFFKEKRKSTSKKDFLQHACEIQRLKAQETHCVAASVCQVFVSLRELFQQHQVQNSQKAKRRKREKEIPIRNRSNKVIGGANVLTK